MAVSHVFLAGAAAAQNYPKVAPRLPEAAPPAQVAPPAASDASRDRRPDAADPVLLPELKGVVFVDSLPKNPSGKLLKRELRLRFEGHYGAA